MIATKTARYLYTTGATAILKGDDLRGSDLNGNSGAARFSASVVESAVRHLLSEIFVRGMDVHASEPDPDSEDVLLDVVVDGVRCMLSRTSVPGLYTLSPRELQIATMVAQGYPNKLIASALAISSWTVSTHLRRIFAKLAVSSRASMVARLMQDGMRARKAFRAPTDPQRSELNGRPALQATRRSR